MSKFGYDVPTVGEPGPAAFAEVSDALNKLEDLAARDYEFVDIAARDLVAPHTTGNWGWVRAERQVYRWDDTNNLWHVIAPQWFSARATGVLTVSTTDDYVTIHSDGRRLSELLFEVDLASPDGDVIFDVFNNGATVFTGAKPTIPAGDLHVAATPALRDVDRWDHLTFLILDPGGATPAVGANITGMAA